MKARASMLLPVGDGDRQPLLDQPHAFQRDPLAERMEEGAAIGFQAVRQRIHAGPRRDLGRQADGEFRIGNHHLGQHQRVEDDLLGVVAGIGDDRGAADLRAGAGGGRHGDDRRDAVRIGARPPVLAILEIEDRARLAGHEGDQLADVHGRAAAEGDDAVMAAGLVGGDAVLEVLQRRIAVDLGEDRDGNLRLLQDVERRGHDRQVDKARIGDQQRPGDAGCGKRIGQFGDAAGTEADGGRIGPVGAQRRVLVDHGDSVGID